MEILSFYQFWPFWAKNENFQKAFQGGKTMFFWNKKCFLFLLRIYRHIDCSLKIHIFLFSLPPTDIHVNMGKYLKWPDMHISLWFSKGWHSTETCPKILKICSNDLLYVSTNTLQSILSYLKKYKKMVTGYSASVC